MIKYVTLPPIPIWHSCCTVTVSPIPIGSFCCTVTYPDWVFVLQCYLSQLWKCCTVTYHPPNKAKVTNMEGNFRRSLIHVLHFILPDIGTFFRQKWSPSYTCEFLTTATFWLKFQISPSGKCRHSFFTISSHFLKRGHLRSSRLTILALGIAKTECW